MKKIAFFSIALFYTLFANALNPTTKTKFTFSGTVIGQTDGFVYLHYTDKDGKWINDSCLVKNGKFHFDGQINEPTRSYFTDKTNSRWLDDPNFGEFFLEPANIQAVFEVGNFKHSKITGSKSQNEFVDAFHATEKVEKKWKPMLDQMMDARHTNDWKKSDSIRNIFYATYLSERNQSDYNFIASHPNSCVSACLLGDLKTFTTLDSTKMFYANFSPRIKQSVYGKDVMKYIKAKENIAIGKTAPSFNEKDVNGNNVSLKDFSGKYVLLEFWASWCEPCRAENPNLLKTYHQYKDANFTILGISINTAQEKDAWLKAIQHDNLPWLQTCDFKGWQSDVANQYNVHSVPANFLIDPTGKIVGINLQGDDLNKKLVELLAKN